MTALSVCARCTASPRRGCCYLGPDDKEDLETFPISISDVERVVRATGKKPSEFMRVDTVDETLAAETLGYPDMAKLLTGGLRLRLAPREDGYCKLFGPNGCTLTHDERPRICALFPTYYRRGDVNMIEPTALASAEGCLAVAEAGSGTEQLFALLGTSIPEVVDIASAAAVEADDHVGRAAAICTALDQLQSP